jgi:hypothetical protein
MESLALIELSLHQGSLAQRLEDLLSDAAAEGGELAYSLDDLSLQLGARLPDLAQTATFWHRGDVGRALRRHGYRVRVELGRVIFVAGAEFVSRRMAVNGLSRNGDPGGD